MAKKLGNVVGLRLTDSDVQKLDALARSTFRGRSDIVRLLLSQADLRSMPDILLSPIPREPPVVDAPEKAHVSA